MATTGSIKHPIFDKGLVNDLYMFFGIVQFFPYHKKTQREMRDMPVITSAFGFVEAMRWSETLGTSTKGAGIPPVKISSIICHDERVFPCAVHKDDAILLVKKNSHDLSHLNDFITEEVKKLYYFASFSGWSSINSINLK